MLLVDTDVWIEAFKNSHSSVIALLSALVIEKQACVTPIIRAELLSGARNDGEYRFLEDRLTAVPLLDEKLGLWDACARARFQLARLGIQESLLDLSIACNAHQHRTPLWTLDKRFMHIQKVIPFKRADF